jgi:hypothetical protein
MDNRLPIHVFKMTGENIERVLAGERVGTVVSTHLTGEQGSV